LRQPVRSQIKSGQKGRFLFVCSIMATHLSARVPAPG
jgi:hypothetical protein